MNSYVTGTLPHRLGTLQGGEMTSITKTDWLLEWGPKEESVQFSRSVVATPWTAAHQASLSITNYWSPPKPMSIELVMPSSHLILCCPLLLLPSIFPSIRVFSDESALCIRWSNYWSFSFNISPSNDGQRRHGPVQRHPSSKLAGILNPTFETTGYDDASIWGEKKPKRHSSPKLQQTKASTEGTTL